MYLNIQTNTATSCVYTETTLVKTVLLYYLTDLVYIDLFLELLTVFLLLIVGLLLTKIFLTSQIGYNCLIVSCASD